MLDVRSKIMVLQLEVLVGILKKFGQSMDDSYG